MVQLLHGQNGTWWIYFAVVGQIFHFPIDILWVPECGIGNRALPNVWLELHRLPCSLLFSSDDCNHESRSKQAVRIFRHHCGTEFLRCALVVGIIHLSGILWPSINGTLLQYHQRRHRAGISAISEWYCHTCSRALQCWFDRQYVPRIQGCHLRNEEAWHCSMPSATPGHDSCFVWISCYRMCLY